MYAFKDQNIPRSGIRNILPNQWVHFGTKVTSQLENVNHGKVKANIDDYFTIQLYNLGIQICSRLNRI